MVISCYMKIKSIYKKSKLAGACIPLIASLVFYVSVTLAPPSILHCLDNQQTISNKQNIAQCTNTYLANRSWFVWLTGGSQSAYFHYLDLIELLNPR